MSNKPGLLVTGASGFVGRHVVTLGRGRFDIVATGRGLRPSWLPTDVAWHSANLLDRASVAELPDDLPFVLHLASESVPSKFSGYDPVLESIEMTLNLCRHLRSGRLLFVGSCLIYAASRVSLTENSPLNPRGGYGLAKELSEAIVLRAGTEGKVETAVARPFNHIGAGMRPDLAIPSIVRRVHDAADGDMIQMAGLDSLRDFLDVRDIVEAYFAILTLPAYLAEQRIFNVSSGTATSIGDVVRSVADILDKSIGGVSFADRDNSADDSFSVIGDASRLREATGWIPQIGLKESLRRLITEMAVADWQPAGLDGQQEKIGG